MSKLPSPIEACRQDLFSPEDELMAKYPPALAQRVMRLREMYNYWLANPSIKDRQLRDVIMSRFEVSQSTAYSDIQIIRQIVPMMAQQSRSYHRARFVEMILETYNMAKARKDTKVMAQAAANYAKYVNLDKEDEMDNPLEDIKPQKFVASEDPRSLGIEPIPDIYNYIEKLTKELSRDFRDIVDVECEDVDLEEKFLFAPLKDDPDRS